MGGYVFESRLKHRLLFALEILQKGCAEIAVIAKHKMAIDVHRQDGSFRA